jgi:hypothetical protein
MVTPVGIAPVKVATCSTGARADTGAAIAEASAPTAMIAKS